MPRTNRPPLAAARTEATKALIELHKTEHEKLIADWLAEAGWTQTTITETKWAPAQKEN
jgi:hypothetical protein